MAKKTSGKASAKAVRRPSERRVRALLEQIGPEFLEAGARRVSAAEVRQAVGRSATILDAFDRHRQLRRFRSDAEKMLSMLGDYASGQYTYVPVWTVALATFALLYVLKPIDIIPDALPEIGRMDDALVVSHAIALTRVDVQNYKVWRMAADIR